MNLLAWKHVHIIPLFQWARCTPEEKKKVLLLACKDESLTENVLLVAYRQKVLASDKSVRQYTGMISKKFLCDMFIIINKRVIIKYWRGAKKTLKLDKNKSNKGRKPKTSKFDEYLITLIHIRTGMQIPMLSDILGLSQSVVSNILVTWINVLFQVFKKLLKWPSAEIVRKNLPKNYPQEYRDTRTILDCTEFFTVKPKNTSAQAATYSQYKHHNTVKVLIGITPTGLITFVSEVYGGNTSDRHIAEKEFISKVMPGDAIMVDRGFNIADLLLARGAKLHMPPFTRKNSAGQKTLLDNEIKRTRDIASLRIHVERAIERMKNFKILSHKIEMNTWPRLHQLLVIVAVICNMYPPLLRE